MTTYALVYVISICGVDVDTNVDGWVQQVAKTAISSVMNERESLLAGVQIIDGDVHAPLHVERARVCLVHRFDKGDESTWDCEFAHISGLPANPHVLFNGVAYHIRDSVAYIVISNISGKQKIEIVSEDEYKARFITAKQALKGAYL